MDKRSNQILNQLLAGGRLQLAEISEKYQISERIVRKKIRELNDELNESGLPSVSINGEGILRFEVREEGLLEQIQKFIMNNDFYTYHLSKNERKTILAMLLLNQEKYVTAAWISEYISTSRNTVISDLNDLKDWFLKHNMKLVSQVQKGYIVEASEGDIRSGMLKLLELNLDEEKYGAMGAFHVFGHLLLKEIQYQGRYETIQKVLREEELRHDCFLSDFSFSVAVYELLILAERVKKGKTLEQERQPDWENASLSSKYPLSRAVLDRLAEEFSLDIPAAEAENFVFCLRRKSYLKSGTNNVDQLVIPVLIGEVIYRIISRFRINFYLDFALYDLLVDHMKSSVYRMSSGEVLENPFRGEIEKGYPEVFCTVEECLKPLEDYLGVKVPREEVSFLVMYFASMLERDKLERMRERKVPAVLVCAMGRGTVQLMLAKLKQLEDVLEITDVRSSHELKDMGNINDQLVISTVAFPDGEIQNILMVSPLLEQEDIYRIRRKATKLRENWSGGQTAETGKFLKKQKKAERNSLGAMLSADRIALKQEAQSWEEGVRAAGRLLYESGAVTYEYIEAMVENIKVNGSYVVIYSGIAAPHAEQEKGAVREAASLVSLKKPVVFGNSENDPVSYIIGLSILNANSINCAIYNLVRLFSQEEAKSRIEAQQSPEELLETIRRLEDEYCR
ncbi:BglG family transcription antiterminator [Anaerostipes caccae]|uniref:BglG family transcription antiterminator n=1 Tax=Anaerostipes caccae TaxID=105841 RepID=UPI001D06209C|nr:PTS sugar transporter subunit IIA [Anaerostipes caccae]MCB6296813.1 PTS sugar transporter subunit IIA [Anaerostipes caccae]MCB6338031.1 PTS sugar transporter subunit IIA [Anaerostipes caccae]MCB6341135.1 PTS sugar transporter subunit IIA [Anaerostipes caccae]MCB6354541.1 PTS sugar transporter subunit IIA [Anaerostipes caccae]MCB6361436.1 PTS sugar transporter subunit IIA [Anaerostipes caccae]